MDSAEQPNTIDEQARDAFLSIIDAPESEWSELADRASGRNQGLREAIERLLVSQRQLGTFHEVTQTPFPPTVGMVKQDAPSDSFELDPTQTDQIGPYRIIERLGQGGMGVVYLAEQREPVRRRVALKVIKRGMDSEQVVARFEAERQALALMNHPNIAGVLDAGMTNDGRPFFVMDLVRGIPITEYCDKHALKQQDRLILIQAVCQAVQHAHQKGIIHRDIKPTNVLVELHDVTHVPKVIDFGVAKATSQQLTDRTLVTQFMQMIGTPLYMSPEQAELSGLDVDTRSDVYSLGVLLYELITGSTPFDRETFRNASLDEMRRIIREVEPLRPSQRISTLEAKDVSTFADKSGIDPRQVKVRVSKELDWIILKALEKDRSRRYESASSLARDIQRYLDNEPLEAGPPSVRYRLGKAASRRKGTLVSASLVLLSLIAATSVSVWYAFQAQEAVQQTEAAIEKTNQANEQLIDESRAKGKAIVAYQDASELADTRFRLALDALDGFLIRVTDDEQLQELQFEKLRENLLTSALPFLETLMEERSDDRAALTAKTQALLRVGMIQHSLGKYHSAIHTFQEVPPLAKKLGQFDEKEEWHRIQRDYHFGLGRTEVSIGANHQALSNLKEASHYGVMLMARSPSPRDREFMASITSLTAATFERMDRFIEARDASQRSLAVWKSLAREFPENRRYVNGLINCRGAVALSLSRQRKYQEACNRYRDNIAQLKALLASSPSSRSSRLALARTHDRIAFPLRGTGQYSEAKMHVDEAMKLSQQLMDEFPDIPRVVQCWGQIRNNVGNQLKNEDLQASRDMLTSTIETMEQYEERFFMSTEFMFCLAKNYIDLGNTFGALNEPIVAIAQLQDGQLILERLSDLHPEIPIYRASLANCLYDQAWILYDAKRFTNAIYYQEMAIGIQDALTAQLQDEPNYAEQLARMHSDLGHFLSRLLRDAEAKSHFETSFEILESLVDRFPEHESSRYFYAVVSHNRGFHEQAIELLESLHQEFSDNAPKYNRILASAHFSLGESKRDSFEEAMSHLVTSVNAFCELFAESTGTPDTHKLRFSNCLQLMAILRAQQSDPGAHRDFETSHALFQQCLNELGADHPTLKGQARALVTQCIELLDGSQRQVALTAWRDLYIEHAPADDADYQEIFALIDEALADSSTVAIHDASIAEGDWGMSELVFSVTRDGYAAMVSTVNWSTGDQSAIAGDDYESTSGQLVFDVDETTKTIRIPVFGDTKEEGFETLSVTLEDLNRGQLVDAEAVGTLENDDTSIFVSDVEVTEGDTTLGFLGTFVPEGSGGLSRPRIITFGPDGNQDGVEDLYVASADTDEILRYDGLTGDFIDPFISGEPLLDNPLGLAFSPINSDLYVVSGPNVLRFDGKTGRLVDKVVTGMDGASGLSFFPSGVHRGDLLIAQWNKDRVLRFDGMSLTEFVTSESGGLDNARHVILGPRGDLYVISRETRQVLKYSGEDGRFLAVAAEIPLPSVSWIEFGRDGLLYATGRTTEECCDNTLLQINPKTGVVLQSLDLQKHGWSFVMGPNNILYCSGNGFGNFIQLIGPVSNASFDIRLSEPVTSPVTVRFHTNHGTADQQDYVARGGVITIEPGIVSRSILVPTVDDPNVESEETFSLRVSDASFGTIINGIGTAEIVDDEGETGE